jgi:subfamily B ATP-binding cassette protein MsbA
MKHSKTSSKRLYLRLLHYVRPSWKVFALSVLCTIGVSATEPALPALLKPLLDSGFVNRDERLIGLLPVLIVGLFLLRGVLTFASDYTIKWVSTKLVMDLRNLMFEKLVSLPTTFFDNRSTGAISATIAYNVGQVTMAATSVVTIVVRDSFTVLGLLGWMFYINWKLTLLTLVIAPVVAIIVYLFSKRMRMLSRSAQHAIGHLNDVLGETVKGHKVIKIFGGQAYENRRFYVVSNQLRRLAIKRTIANSANAPLVQIVAAFALAVIVHFATLESATSQITVGGFVSYITAMLMLMAPMKRLTSTSDPLQQGLAAAEVVFDLIDQKPEEDSGTIELGRSKGALEFRNVTLRYDERNDPAIDNISMNINPGESVALVGQSGSGKTTLANLIPRLYHPTSGQILIDGHDIETIALRSLRENIALVSQDVVLFNDTIAANIAYGQKESSSPEQILQAAETAHAMEFIRQLPMGLDTLIGENGVKLSGGQRQRIAIARAILKNAPILILDEATSALDTESERHVQAALENLMQNRTTIIIAHRLSTVEKADRIVVMEKGRIVESGTHDDLLATKGFYERLQAFTPTPTK